MIPILDEKLNPCRSALAYRSGEGLEPKVTEELVRLMLSARGGKIQRGG
jgi:hypothetical protein